MQNDIFYHKWNVLTKAEKIFITNLAFNGSFCCGLGTLHELTIRFSVGRKEP